MRLLPVIRKIIATNLATTYKRFSTAKCNTSCKYLCHSQTTNIYLSSLFHVINILLHCEQHDTHTQFQMNFNKPIIKYLM